MFRFAIEKPVIISVAMAIVCIFGLVGIFSVPIQMIPDLDPRIISVRTNWVGATPQDVEKEILTEQEKYLVRIPGLERMTSTAQTGRARIQLEFPHGADLNESLVKVSNALDRVSNYPENVVEPVISANSFSTSPFMFFRILPRDENVGRERMAGMRDFIEDHVAPRVERVNGVSAVSFWGGAERQIRIQVDPARLAERELTLVDVRNAIRARNRDVSGGDMNTGKRRYLLRTIGRFASIDEIESLVIARRGDSLVRLRDVGSAELSNLEVRFYSYANGRPNITMGVRRQVGSNVVEVMDGVTAAVAELNQGLLAHNGLKMELTSEDVQYVRDAVSVVRRNLVIGGVLAVLVLLIFLRSPSATLVGAVGMPVCTIAAFLGLLLAGRTINVISLAGVAFAIGMTLDNSIVVLESIYRHTSQGKPRRQAALDGVREVWTAVLASTLTTVFVFLPIILIREEAGQLYSDIAVAISAAILLSMVVAITVIPAACSRFLDPPAAQAARPNPLTRFGGVVAGWINGFAAWLVGGVTRRLVLIGGVLGVSLLVIHQLTPKAEYLPEGEEQKLFASMYAPPGYNVETMHRMFLEFDPQFVAQVGADPEKFARGETDIPALNFAVGYAGADSIFYIPEATERAQVDDLVEVVAEKMKPFPGVRSFVSRGSIFQGNRGGSRSINLDISGPDLATLFDTGNRIYERAREIFDNPQVRLQPSTLSMNQPLIEVRPNWERAAELGIDANDLGYMVSAYSDGAYVDEYFLDDSRINMYLYSSDGAVQRPDDLNGIPIYSREGGVVPLASVAEVVETFNTNSIRRIDGSRTITLSIIPPRDVPLESGINRVRGELVQVMRDSGEIDNSVRIHISGAGDRLQATRDALAGNFLVAILVSYLLMVAIFSHWGYPLLIMVSVPIGVSGGIIGLWVLNRIGAGMEWLGLATFQQPFDMITMLGFLVLIGTVVNNPILIVERSLGNLRRGMAAAEAVLEAVKIRLRPIMMSTITTIFGLSPLVFYPGAGTELYRGLGAIVLFGLLFSTVVTLTFMPAALSLVLQWQERARARPAAEAGPAEPA